MPEPGSQRSQGSQGPRKAYQCGTCGKVGHNNRTCPAQVRSPQPIQPAEPRAARPCSLCRIPGHIAKDCPPKLPTPSAGPSSAVEAADAASNGAALPHHDAARGSPEPDSQVQPSADLASQPPSDLDRATQARTSSDQPSDDLASDPNSVDSGSDDGGLSAGSSNADQAPLPPHQLQQSPYELEGRGFDATNQKLTGSAAVDDVPIRDAVVCKIPMMQTVPAPHRAQWARAMAQALRSIMESQRLFDEAGADADSDDGAVDEDSAPADELRRALIWFMILHQLLLRRPKGRQARR